MAPPVVVSGLEIKPSSEVRDWVLANAGARPADRGPVDERIIREVRTRTGDTPKAKTTWAAGRNCRRTAAS